MIEEYNWEEFQKTQLSEGIKLGKLEVSRNLLKAMTDTQIADMTGLTIEAVAELRNNAQPNH